MNLRGIANSATKSVNPNVPATIYQSNGFTTSAAFKQIPAYLAPLPAIVQRQQLSFKDLKQIDGLNLEGILQSVYINGQIYGVDRGAKRGGDLFVFGDGKVWLVVAVAEQWPDWCRVIINLQTDAAAPGAPAPSPPSGGGTPV